jgi:hypothetical protein
MKHAAIVLNAAMEELDSVLHPWNAKVVAPLFLHYQCMLFIALETLEAKGLD